MRFVRRVHLRRRVTAVPLLLMAVGLALSPAACGDEEPVVVVVWPEMNGTYQYRSLIPLQDGLTCVEFGDITISHPGADTFTGSGEITLNCWLDGELSQEVGTVQFANGRFGPETNKESWPMTWDGRASWTYSGEAFWATPAQMKATGVGTGVVDLGDGPVNRNFSWTICRRFTYQNDAVEHGCDYT